MELIQKYMDFELEKGNGQGRSTKKTTLEYMGKCQIDKRFYGNNAAAEELCVNKGGCEMRITKKTKS